MDYLTIDLNNMSKTLDFDSVMIYNFIGLINRESGGVFVMKNSFSVERITLAMKGVDLPGKEYCNYAQGRKVCGVVVVLGGCSEFIFSDGRVKKLQKGDIALFSESSAYIVKNGQETTFPHYTVNFILSTTSTLPADETYIKADNLKDYERKCEAILNCMKSGDISNTMMAMSNLYSIISDILGSENIEMYGREDYKQILPAINCIETEYGNNLNIELLAKKCAMSKTNFRRVFTELCGASPIEYLLRKRMERATVLLCQTYMSISEISSLCGFKDTEYFCRTFKKRMGKTASEMRKNN